MLHISKHTDIDTMKYIHTDMIWFYSYSTVVPLALVRCSSFISVVSMYLGLDTYFFVGKIGSQHGKEDSLHGYASYF